MEGRRMFGICISRRYICAKGQKSRKKKNIYIYGISYKKGKRAACHQISFYLAFWSSASTRPTFTSSITKPKLLFSFLFPSPHGVLKERQPTDVKYNKQNRTDSIESYYSTEEHTVQSKSGKIVDEYVYLQERKRSREKATKKNKIK